MKLAIALLACVGLVAATSLYKTGEVKIADKTFLEKQRFLYEIVYRVEDPLMFEEWIKLGENFIYDKSFYSHWDIYMEKFWESYKTGVLLPHGEFFGALVKTHHKQAWGLFNFFYYAKDWQTFLHNVCWARMHVNEGMFVYALTLAVIHRDDFKGLSLPTIYEIFPQHFFNSKFIMEAEKFDYDVWSKYSMYEKEFYDVYYRNNKYYTHDYMYVRDWKVWQWWKLMGLNQHWYSVDKFILRDNIYEFNQDPKWLSMFEDMHMFWMPVDYTRDIAFYNEHTVMSYFTEDLDWNAFWYYFNMDYAFFLDGHTFGLDKDRRGEYWLHVVQQMMARYYFERLSHNFGDIPEFSWHHTVEYGYNPELISWTGVGFSYRKNYWEVQTYANFDMYNQVWSAFDRIYKVIDLGYYKTHDGHMIDLRKPEAIEYIGSYMQGNVDMFDKYFFTYWYMLSQMYFSDVDYNDFDVMPHVFLNFETMLRDPMFYMFHKKIADVFYRFWYHFKPYTHEDLFFPGVEIKHVAVDELVTYFDFTDFDVTNLLNDKMKFVDGKFVWDKSLFGRQMRLNHKPFEFDFTVQSDKEQKVVIRTFIGPKFDEYGRLISLTDNRENFYELDEFVWELKSGDNTFSRKSYDYFWTIADRTTYTEMYKYVMMAYDGKFDFPMSISEPHCGFPDRLILPKGWYEGMPVQFFFMVTPYMHPEHEVYSTYDYTWYCGIGSGARHVDTLPFGYPFNRVIDEYDFFVPNMYFMDAKIYHYDTFEPYYHGYKNYGHFDYSFWKDYFIHYFNH